MTELKAKPRTELGNKVGALRRDGFLPAVLYGEGVPSQSISIPYKDFEKAYREAGESTLVKLEIDGKPFNVLIHDIAYDPLKGSFLHADFYAVRMDKVIRTRVPVEFVGESSAVKNEGGVLIKVIQEVEVEALPQDLPHTLKADLSLIMALAGKILIKDIKLPKGVKVTLDKDEVLALVDAPRSEAELEELAAAPAAELKEVKTEQEVKRAEAEAKAIEKASSEAEK